MSRAARFLRLPLRDQLLILEASTLIWAFRLALWFVPFSTTRKLVSKLAAQRGRRRHEEDRLAWAVEAAGRGPLASNCLSKALAAQVMLSRSGHQSEIKVGVAREPGGHLSGHAWVESGGRVLVGGAELAKYQAASGSGRVVP